MRYEILGPLQVVDHDEPSEIRTPKIGTVLAVLLIRANQVVSYETLIGEIWGDESPRRAIAGTQVYISQLRKFLHRPNRERSPVITKPAGYMLRLDDDEVDVHLFRRLTEHGRRSLRAGRHGEACASFEAALSLWRGPALGELRSGPIIDGFIAGLIEARLECLELLADSKLQLGMHREMVSRLSSLIVENPLRETFYRQLMLALYRSERQGDALKVYQAVRKTLNDELGVEPGRPLRDLQQAILAGEGRLE